MSTDGDDYKPAPNSPVKVGLPRAAASTRHVSSNNNNTAPPRPLVSTPARDPAALVAKRMHHLQLHGAPSQLSPGILANSPMRVNTFGGTAPYSRHDLTPVMKNTTGTTQRQVDLDFDLDCLCELDFDLDKLTSDNRNVVSPDGAAVDGFHGEHLTLPDDLGDGCGRGSQSTNSRVLPPLAKRGILPVHHPQRRGSTGQYPNFDFHEVTVPTVCTSVIRAPELTFFPEAEEPIPFPPSGKSNTFTSRKHYEKHMMQQQQHQNSDLGSNDYPSGLRPYQPSRRDPGLVDIPQEALDSIFITRRRSDQSGIDTNGTLSSSTGPSFEDDDMPVHEPPRLFATIPLEERQWSIPSIRMANHLGGGSVTSATTYTDEEDESLLYYRDDASLSSLGSHTNVMTLVGLQAEDAPFVVSVTTPQAPDSHQDHQQQQCSFDSSEPTPPLLPMIQLGQGCSSSNPTTLQHDGNNTDYGMLIQPQPPTSSSRYHQRRRRLKRKEQRDRQAFEWLRTVKASTDEVAEAASSKFLTGRSGTLEGQRPLKRLSSAAVETSSFAFLALQDCMDKR
jgi:hypothetical protein